MDDLCVSPTKGDASCVSFVDYCVLDFIPPYFRPHFCDCTFSAGEGLVVVSLLSVSAPQAETDARLCYATSFDVLVTHESLGVMVDVMLSISSC